MVKLRFSLAAILISVFGLWLGGQVLSSQPVMAGSDGDKKKTQKTAQPADGSNASTTPTASDGNGPTGLDPTTGAGKTDGSTSSGTGSCPQTMFFFLPTWYEFLDCTADEGGTSPGATFNFPDDLTAVAAAFTDMLVRLAGLVAVIAVIMGGVGYITAGGSPEKTASARRRIYNALIGLAIVAVASAFIRFIGNRLGGS